MCVQYRLTPLTVLQTGSQVAQVGLKHTWWPGIPRIDASYLLAPKTTPEWTLLEPAGQDCPLQSPP